MECNKKMNMFGTMRCELDANHDGGCAFQVVKAPKQQGRISRMIKTVHPVQDCVGMVIIGTDKTLGGMTKVVDKVRS